MIAFKGKLRLGWTGTDQRLNIAMVDGSVTWVNNSVTPAVYLAAFTRAGGEALGTDF